MCNYLKIRRKGTKKSAIPQIYFAKKHFDPEIYFAEIHSAQKSGIDYVSDGKLQKWAATAHFCKFSPMR